jgi:hypothetical protein
MKLEFGKLGLAQEKVFFRQKTVEDIEQLEVQRKNVLSSQEIGKATFDISVKDCDDANEIVKSLEELQKEKNDKTK